MMIDPLTRERLVEMARCLHDHVDINGKPHVCEASAVAAMLAAIREFVEGLPKREFCGVGSKPRRQYVLDDDIRAAAAALEEK